MKKGTIKLTYKYRKIIQIYIDIVKDLENFDSEKSQLEFKTIYKNELANLNQIIKKEINKNKHYSEKKKILKNKFLLFLRKQFNSHNLKEKFKLTKALEKRRMWIKKNSKNQFVMKIQKDFMYGVEEPWCNNQGVAILPYVLKDNEYYFLQIFKENNPLFKNNKISDYSTITGGLETSNPYETVIHEMSEETVIDVRTCLGSFIK